MIRVAATLPAALALALALPGCAGPPGDEAGAARRASSVQSLLVQGAAHAEIDEWQQALAKFEQAAALAVDDPAVVFDIAVARFRSGEPRAARETLERLNEDIPPTLAARAEYLRGKLALEEGDVRGEAAAYRRAAELDPAEPAYPYTLSQVTPRLGGADADAEVGALLERAVALWPDNTRLAAELAQWSLGRSDASDRARGLGILTDLSRGQPRLEELVELGRAELERLPTGPAPLALRRALNLLRPSKRFRTDSARLEARLQVTPLRTPVSAELRRPQPAAEAGVLLEEAQLSSAPELAPDERLLAVVAANDVGDEPPAGAREADLVVLTDRALWFLGRGAAAPLRLAALAERPRQVLAGELDGDGRTDIVLLAPSGLRLWSRARGDWLEQRVEPALAAGGPFHHGLLMDFEHDGDLDLLAVDADGLPLLATHRGESGLGPAVPAPLPLDGPVHGFLASDLDGDDDQDLVAAGPEALILLSNERQGEFEPAGRLALPAPADHTLSTDYDGDGRFDLVALAGGELLFWRNRDPGGLAPDEAAAAGHAAGPQARSLVAADLDLDGDPDLILGAGPGETSASALAVLENAGNGGFRAGAKTGSPAAGGIRGILALDLDGDYDPDLLGWNEGGLRPFLSTGAEGQGWLALALRGLKGKVPLDGRGVKVLVSFGAESRTLELSRPEVVLGLGRRAPALVKVTWPNGISEYLFEPEPGRRHRVEQVLRIEGSCPFLYASDGEDMRFVTDILGLAPLGMLAAPGRYVEADPEEYLRLPDWVSAQGSVELRITEELREVAYIDQTELVVVDAPAGIEVYNGERWVVPPVRGLDLRLLGPLRAPAAVIDGRGREVAELVAAADRRYLSPPAGERLYQGASPLHSLVVRFPDEIAASGRAALVLVGWLHWANTSTNLARAQDPRGAPVFPFLEVPAREGGWRRTGVAVGLPAGKTKPVVVDLGGIVDPRDPRVRISTDFEVHWDRIAVSVRMPTAATPHRVHRLAPSSAELRYGGFSRWYRPAPDGPYLFDYADRRPYPWRDSASGPRPLSWLEHEGFYTPFGPAAGLVGAADDRLVIFGSGEELVLGFDTTSLPPLPDGWRRTLFLHSEGWEKDGDPNVACSQTVEPLPYRGMGAYPCPEAAATATPAQRSDAATRWVDRNRLGRRVAATAGR